MWGPFPFSRDTNYFELVYALIMLMKKNTYFTILRIVALIGALAVIVLLLFSSLGQKTAYDNNILFVVDLSYSMNAKDITSVEG